MSPAPAPEAPEAPAINESFEKGAQAINPSGEEADVLKCNAGSPKGMKTLCNSDISGARKNVKDIEVYGNGDAFQLLCKASSEREGWMKSTKAMSTPNGAIVQVSTQQRNPDGSYAVAEALVFVPGVTVRNDQFGGRELSAK